MLVGRKVALRPLEEADLPLLVEWRNHPATMQMFYTPLLISISGQKKWYTSLLNDPTRMMFLIVQLTDSTPVGAIGMMNIDWQNHSFEPGPFFLDPNVRGDIISGDALSTLLRYAFHELNMQRAYATVMDFNQTMFRGSQHYGFRPEQVARKAAFVNGEFHDVIHMAVLREDWEKTRWGKRE